MTGLNLVAACLVSRKLRSMLPDVEVEISGQGMDHRVTFWRPGHKARTVTSARQWYRIRAELLKELE